MKAPNTRLFKHSFAAAVVGILASACDSDTTHNATPQPTEMQGIWEHVGYGNVIDVDSEGADYYQFTRASCLLAERADNHDLAELFAGATLAQDKLSLQLNDADTGPFPVTFSKRSSLPPFCEPDRLLSQATNTDVFDHFAQTYADYYAFFDERGVDWVSHVNQLRPQLSDDMSEQALFAVMSDLIAPLEDGHVQLDKGDEIFRPAPLVGANRAVVDAFAQQSEYSDLQEYANRISLKFWQNIGEHLDEGSVEAFDGAIPDRVIWGTLEDGAVGYLYIASMAYLSDSEEGLDSADNTAVMHRVMREAMQDLGSTQSLIIDLRSNSGGHDEVSHAVAGYFSEQTSFYGSKHARSYLGDTQRVNAELSPVNASPYLNPVAIIVGEETASAAESFLIAMRAMPRVTVVGENTHGILSDVLEKSLPNGWEFWLANEVYYDHLDAVHEVVGISPDIAAPVFSIPAIEAGNSPAIETALQVLGH